MSTFCDGLRNKTVDDELRFGRVEALTVKAASSTVNFLAPDPLASSASDTDRDSGGVGFAGTAPGAVPDRRVMH